MRFLDATLKKAAKETIAYTRYGTAAGVTEAIPGRNRVALQVIDTAQMSEVEFDWLATASELTISGNRTEPQKGDLITWTNPAGQVLTFTVLPDVTERCFRYVDQTQHMLRIHTKLTGVA